MGFRLVPRTASPVSGRLLLRIELEYDWFRWHHQDAVTSARSIWRSVTAHKERERGLVTRQSRWMFVHWGGGGGSRS